MELKPVDVLRTPALQGVFEPVQREIDVARLEVVAGEVPTDLDGAYVRNGPNARFDPIGSYTYPLDGDGMLHAVYLSVGNARYRNRYVRTPSLLAEERAGRALWGGVLTPNVLTAEQVGPELAGRYKDLPDIHIVRHAGRYLALSEGARQFAVTSSLETIGPETFGGALPNGFCAHPRFDAETGDMLVFRYAFEPPYLHWSRISAQGEVTVREHPVPLDAPRMIHDFVITERYLVLFACPAIFDFDALGTGRAMLAFRRDLSTRIAVVDRHAPERPVRWFELPAFWVWHFANAYETEDQRIVLDFPYHSTLVLGGNADRESTRSGMMRCTLDLSRGDAKLEQRDERVTEFPRIDDRRTGRPHRYVWVVGKPGTGAEHSRHFQQLFCYDLQRDQVVERSSEDGVFGEPVFAPRHGGQAENDGYILTFLTHLSTLETELLILHAEDISAPPAAVLKLPQRVPLGLHGNWFARPL